MGKLFLAVAMLALACAGMKYRTWWWTSGLVTLSFFFYAIAAVRAAGLQGRDKIISIAFALIGCSYLFFITCSSNPGVLITNYPLAVILRNLRMIPFPPPIGEVEQSIIDQALQGPYRRGGPMGIVEENFYNFFLIGHCVWSWLFALLAGWFAARMYDRRQRQTAAPTLASPPASDASADNIKRVTSDS